MSTGEPRDDGKPAETADPGSPSEEDLEALGAEDLDDDAGELVPEDDRVIGRAFRISGVVALAIVAIVVAVILLKNLEPAPVVVDEAPTVLPRAESRGGDAPALRFTDVTRAAGIEFVQENGAKGQKLLPETMGSGAAFFDLEGDGDPDLLLVNGNYWPGEAPPGSAPPTLALYRNDGAGRFEDITAASGLAVSLYGTGVAVGDVDGDGDDDLFVSALGHNRLFWNDGGTFTDRTAAAGVAGEAERWSTSAAFFDADGDQDLDLFVCNYIQWSREIDFEVDYQLVGIGRAYGPPTQFEGSDPYFYRNRGDGTFEDATAAAGFHVRNPATGKPLAKALAVVPFDTDEDGDLDLVVANDTVQNLFFRNRGDGTYEEIGARSGLAYDANGLATGAMGIDAARFRDDESLGIGIGNFANEMTSLYVCERGREQFIDESIIEGIGATSRGMLTFGLFFFDVDLDGRLDLLQTNGHLEEEIHLVQPSQRYRQPAQLFWNRGGSGATFLPIEPAATGDLGTPIVGRGASYADIDGDGDLDVLLTQVKGAPLLLRNDQQTGHHWLRVDLRGSAPNTGAIGAMVTLEVGGTTLRRAVQPSRSYLSQVERAVTLGLGDASQVGRLTIRWPSGRTQEVEVPGVDRRLEIEERE